MKGSKRSLIFRTSPTKFQLKKVSSIDDWKTRKKGAAEEKLLKYFYQLHFVVATTLYLTYCRADKQNQNKVHNFTQWQITLQIVSSILIPIKILHGMILAKGQLT